MLLPYSEFKQAIHDNILSCRKCEIICGDCEWSEICYINERKNKKPICWINEQDKILSFHQEEGEDTLIQIMSTCITIRLNL